MKAPTNRFLLMMAAFLGGLALCLGGILWVSGGLPAGSVAHAAVGGPFQLTDENGKTISDENFRGKPFLVFFGFTHCPDICPTTLFEVSEVMRRLGPDADRTAALFITRRSRARHAGKDEGVSVELRSAPARRDRQRRRGRRGREGLSRLLQENSDRPATTTRWITPPSSI